MAFQLSGPSIQLVKVARQQLQTSRYLGVDFVPIVDNLTIEAAGRQMPSGPDDRSVTTALAANLGALKQPITRGDRPDSSDSGVDKSRALHDLREMHDRECPHCTNCTYHQRTVFGEGDPYASLMFIGEAPGEEEDRTGRPFVGRAGQKLNDIIQAMGFAREQVYIANILKARPPDNRTPLEHEIAGCSPYLAEQIRVIQPQVIVALGGPAAKFLLQTETGITRLRGQWGTYGDLSGCLTIPVMPTFHPAYLLRQYTPDTRKKVWADMQAVIARLKALAGNRA